MKYACRALHEKEERHMSRGNFFLIALICSLIYMVHSARIPLLNIDKHLMGLLGILQVRHCPSAWLWHARAWGRSIDT
jgi:hypothetical protein